MKQQRTYSKKQKQALYVQTEGRSMISGKPIDGLSHADHITSYKHGGMTCLGNGQITLPQENLKKGAGQKDRKWQTDFLRSYKSHYKTNYVLSACPAAGKTYAALRAFLGWRESPDDVLAVISPRRHIRDNWQYKAAPFGIELTTRYDGCALNKYNGFSITSAALPGLVTSIQLLCKKRRVFVISDEPHHHGDETSGGAAFAEGFKNAAKRLFLSGTYYRHDGDKIVQSVVTENGYEIDFSYSYNNALADGIVRPVKFDFYNGSRVMQNAYGITELSFNTSDIDNSLGMILDGKSLIGDMLSRAKECEQELTKHKKNGATITTCKDIFHAQTIHNIAMEILGPLGQLAVSDEEANTADILSFQKSKLTHIEAVRQISEGVDIPRLHQLCYLTNITTRQYFEQQIGRITRREPQDSDNVWAIAHLPDHPALKEHAKTFGELVNQGLEEKKQTEAREIEQAAKDKIQSIEISSNAEFKETVLNQQILSDEQIKRCEIVADLHNVSLIKAKEIIDTLDRIDKNGVDSEVTLITEKKPDEVVCVELGQKLKPLVNIIHNKLKKVYDHREIHLMLNDRSGWPRGLKQEKANLEQMQRKHHEANKMVLQ
jgi:hypothetical protein